MQVWAHSYCRSTFAFYEALAKELGRPLRICLAKKGMAERRLIGFEADEFSHLDIVDVSSGKASAFRALDEHADWPQLFGVYQIMPHIQATIREAIIRGMKVGIASEAPCNMVAPSLLRIMKYFYFETIAKYRLTDLTAGSQFIINWSGDDAVSLKLTGWPRSKIIPCGYFPPPLVGSKFVERSISSIKPLHILCSGSMTWHRGPDILMEALVLLKSWGVPFRATFTGTGPLESRLRTLSAEHQLHCDFPGLVPMGALLELYQSCSLFIASGRVEPWGMRLNDALNCGAPVIVSRGMGSAKLVFDYGVGATFGACDSADLALQIRRIVSNPDLYQSYCDNLARFRQEILPEAAARRTAKSLQHFPGWI